LASGMPMTTATRSASSTAHPAGSTARLVQAGARTETMSVPARPRAWRGCHFAQPATRPSAHRRGALRRGWSGASKAPPPGGRRRVLGCIQKGQRPLGEEQRIIGRHEDKLIPTRDHAPPSSAAAAVGGAIMRWHAWSPRSRGRYWRCELADGTSHCGHSDQGPVLVAEQLGPVAVAFAGIATGAGSAAINSA
jgi:hypothetical protein